MRNRARKNDRNSPRIKSLRAGRWNAFERLESRWMLAHNGVVVGDILLPTTRSESDWHVIDDQQSTNWKIGPWERLSASSYWNDSVSISRDPNAYFLWYVRDLSWDQDYDVYLTWQASPLASHQVQFDWGGLAPATSAAPFPTSLDQTQGPHGIAAHGTTWQHVATVRRTAVDYVPYVAMSSRANGKQLQADGLLLIPHTPARPEAAVTGPTAVTLSPRQSLALNAWQIVSDDAGPFQITAHVSAGQWQVTANSAVQPHVQQQGDRQLTWGGDLQQANELFSQITWQPPTENRQPVQLTFTVSHATASAGWQSLTSQTITITSLATGPRLSVPSELVMPLHAMTPWPAESLAQWQLSTDGAADTIWELEIRSESGEIAFSDIPTSVQANLLGPSIARGTGTLFALQTWLQQASFRPTLPQLQTLQLILRDPISRQVEQTAQVQIVPNDVSLIAGYPTSVSAPSGASLDFRALFVTPLPGESRTYVVRREDGNWEPWLPTLGPWIIPAWSEGTHRLRLRLLATQPGNTATLAEVSFALDNHSAHLPDAPQRWRELPSLSLLEDGAPQSLELREFFFGPGPLQFTVAVTAPPTSAAPPISASVVGTTLQLTPLPDRWGGTTVEIGASQPNSQPHVTMWEIDVSPTADPPRVAAPPSRLTLAEDSPSVSIDGRSWFVWPDGDDRSDMRIVASSRDPDRLQVSVQGTQLTLLAQPHANGEVQIDVQAIGPAGPSAPFTWSVQLTPLPDATLQTQPFPAIQLREDQQALWLPLSRYFRDADVEQGTSIWQPTGQLSPLAPVTMEWVRDMGGETYLVVTPLPQRAGSGSLPLQVTDTQGGGAVTVTIPITVAAINDPPWVTRGFDDLHPSVVGEQMTIDLRQHVADPEQTSLQWTVTTQGNLPLPGLTISNDQLRFQAGDASQVDGQPQQTLVIVTASDGVHSTSAAFLVSFASSTPLTIVGADQELIFDLVAGSTDFQHTFTATGSGPRLWTLRPGSPLGLTIDAVQGTLHWNPVSPVVGTYFATVEVQQGAQHAARTVVFQVRPAATPGESLQFVALGLNPFVGARFRVLEEETFTIQVKATGPRPRDIRYELVSGGGSLTESGIYRWTPTDADALGNFPPIEHTVTVRATDGSLSTTGSFLIAVSETNHAPQLSSPQAVRFGLDDLVQGALPPFVASERTPTDSGADAPYRYQLISELVDGSIDSESGVVQWDMGLASRYIGPVTYAIRVEGTDEGGAAAWGLSHLILAGEDCSGGLPCQTVWSPLARDHEIDLYPGETRTVDVRALQLTDDTDSGPASLELYSVSGTEGALATALLDSQTISIGSRSSLGAHGRIGVMYTVIDEDGLLSNAGEVRVFINTLRPDIDMDLDGNGIVETTDAAPVTGSAWNDDWFESRVPVPRAEVPWAGATVAMHWEIDGLSARPLPQDLPYRLQITQSGTGAVTLQDASGVPLPASFPLDRQNPRGTWLVRGTQPGNVTVQLSLSLDGTVLGTDTVPISVIVPPTTWTEMDVQLPDRWLGVGAEDNDNDGLPARAEGYGLIAPSSEDGGLGNPAMIPLTIRVRGNGDLFAGRLQFEYSASPPERSVVRRTTFGNAGTIADLDIYEEGYLRLWRSASQPRNSTDVRVDPVRGMFVGSGSHDMSDFVWTSVGNYLQTTLYVEAVRASNTTQPITVLFTTDESPSLLYRETVEIYPIEADLDVDSDNSGSLEDHPREDAREHLVLPGWTGKLVSVSAGDVDGDGTRDTDDLTQSAPFVLLRFTPRGPLSSQASLRLQYASDDPLTATREGSFRIWRRDGQVTRDGRAVHVGGDYLPGSGVIVPLSLWSTAAGDALTWYVEGVSPGASGEIRIDIDPDGAGPSGFVSSDRIFVRTVQADLDVDSDARLGLERSLQEEALEDDANHPGALLMVDMGDLDQDSVPGWAEGLGGIAPDNSVATWPGAPLALRLDGLPSAAEIRFLYSDSDPADVVRQPTTSLPWSPTSGVGIEQGVTVPRATGTYHLPPGHLRIWNRPLSQPRDPAFLGDGGHFIPSAVALRVDQWNALVDNSQGDSTLWLEAVRGVSTPLTITVQLDLDGSTGPQGWTDWDAVRVSPLEVQWQAPTARPDWTEQSDVPASLTDARGLVVPVNVGDRDGDAVPDFADGIDRWGQWGPNASASFVPLQLYVLAPEMVLRDWQWQFTYSAASPALVQSIPASAPYLTSYSAQSSGMVRLWNRDGDQPRRVASLADQGNYLAPGTSYAWSLLAGAAAQATFYAEGITPTAQLSQLPVSTFLVSTHQGTLYAWDPQRGSSYATGPTLGNVTPMDQIDVHPVEVDLDTDTDGNGLITNDLTEDQYESYAPSIASSLFPGQRVTFWPGDRDGDGIVNIADYQGHQGQAPAPSFTPIRMAWPAPIDIQQATIRFRYPAAESLQAITDPAGGRIRLWLRNGIVDRNPQPLHAGGDWLAPDITYRLADLTGSRETILYVEGITPSHQWSDVLLEVEVDPEGLTGRFPSLVLSPVDPAPPAQGRGSHFVRDSVRLTVVTEQLVTLSATDRIGTERAEPATDPASFTLSRGEQNWQGDLAITFRTLSPLGQEALYGVDYIFSSTSSFTYDPHTRTGMITIPHGRSSSVLNLLALDDTQAEWDEQVRLEVIPTPPTPLPIVRYRVAGEPAQVTLLDQDGYQSALEQNSDRNSTGETPATLEGDHLSVQLLDGRVWLTSQPGTTEWAPNFVGNEGSRPILLLDVELPDVPHEDQLRFVTHFGTATAQTWDYPSNDRHVGPIRVALPIDASSLATGSYDYDVEVHSLVNGATAYTKTVRGQWGLQNLHDAAVGDRLFGPGWWVTAVDRVQWDDRRRDEVHLAQTTYRLTQEGAMSEPGVRLLRGDQSAAWYGLSADQIYLQAVRDSEPGADGYHETLPAVWSPGTHEGGYHSNYRIAAQGTSGAAQSATWTLVPAQTAIQPLLVSWVPGEDRDRAAIYHVQGASPVDQWSEVTAWQQVVDQTKVSGTLSIDGQMWYSLGFVLVTAGQPVTVRLQGSGQGRLVADAVALGGLRSNNALETPAGSFDAMQLTNDALIHRDKWGTITTFDARGLPVSRVDRNGNRIGFTFQDIDGDGRARELLSVDDARLGTTDYRYTAGMLAEVVDFADRSTWYAGTATRTVTLPQPAGELSGPIVWKLQLDHRGRLQNLIDPRETVTRLGYDGTTDRVNHIIEAFRTRDEAEWQVRSLVERAFAAQGQSIAASDVDTALQIDARYNTWQYRLDRYGYTLAFTNPAPFEDRWEWTRNDDGLVITSVEPAGAGGIMPWPALVTTYQYDDHGNRVRETYPDQSYVTRVFDPDFSQLIHESDSLGRQIRYQLDNRGNVLTREEVNRGRQNRLTRYAYTPLPLTDTSLPGGLVTEMVLAADSPDAVTTRHTYYAGGPQHGLPETITTAWGTANAQTFAWNYNAARVMVQETHRSLAWGDRVTQLVPDILGRVVQIVQSDPGTGDHGAPQTLRRYDRLGNLLEQTDPRGTRTSWEYDARGRQTREVRSAPGGSSLADQTPRVTTFTYDGNHNLITSTEGRGVTEHRYDERNWRTTTVAPPPNVANPLHAAPITHWTYDAVGNVRTMRDAQSHADDQLYFTTYAYDQRHRRINTIRPAPGTLDHGATEFGQRYDDAGRMIAELFPTATGIAERQFEYDDLNRLIEVREPPTSAGIAITHYIYDLRDNRITTIDPLLRTTMVRFDAHDRPIEETLPATSPDAGAQVWIYGYSDHDELVSKVQTSTLPGARRREWTLGYDRLGRQIEEVSPDPDGPGPLQALRKVVHYDANANPIRTEEWVDGVSYLHTTDFDHWNRPWHAVGPTRDGVGSETVAIYNRWDEVVTWQERVDATHFRATDFVYDDLGRLYQTLQPAPQAGAARPVVTQRRDALGRVREEIDAQGRVTSFTFDRLGRLILTSNPLDLDGLHQPPPHGEPFPSRDMAYHYAPNDLRIAQTNDAGETTTWEYDSLGRVVREQQPHGETTVRRYDLVGNTVQIQDASQNITELLYDPLGRLVAETVLSPPHVVTRTQRYDDLGDLVETVDRNGRRIGYEYNRVGQKVREAWLDSPEPYVATYGYSARGELTHAADPQSNYAWSYHPGGAIQQQQLALTALPTLHFQADYQLDGLLARRAFSWQVNGTEEYQVRYALDDLGRVTEVRQSASDVTRVTAKEVDFAYHPDGRLATVTRSTARDNNTPPALMSQYEYYHDGLLSRIGHGQAVTGIEWNAHEFAYDRVGRITEMSSPQTGPQTFTYDRTGQLLGRVSETRPEQSSESFAYDPTGNRSGDVDPHNRLQEDAAGRYAYDREGNVTTRWRFQPVAELQPFLRSGGSVSTPPTDLATGWYRLRLDELEFAAQGPQERLLVRIGYASEPFDPSVELWKTFQELSVHSLPLVPLHDNRWALAEGYVDLFVPHPILQQHLVVLFERQADSYVGVSSGTAHWDRLTEIQAFSWDFRNRLQRATVYGPDASGVGGLDTFTSLRTANMAVAARRIHEVEYLYDVLDQRVGRVVQTSPQYSTEYYVSVDGHTVAEYDAAQRPLRRHLYGPAVDQLLATERLDVDGRASSLAWLLTDHLQTVHQLVVEDLLHGAPPQVVRVQYDAFGQPLGESPALRDVRMRATGREFDPETGLAYHRARYLMPDAGRWLSEDPWWLATGDANRYRYVGNNPIQQSDPTGADVCGGICIAALLYVARAAALSGIETSVETAVASATHDDQYSVQHAYTRNFAINLALGWIPGLAESKAAVRTTAFAGRLLGPRAASAAINFTGRMAVNTAADVAWSTGVDERQLRDSVTQALVGNVAGELVGSGLKQLGKGWGNVTPHRHVPAPDLPKSHALTILNPDFTPNASLPDLIIRQVERRGLATPRHGMVLWSGLGRGGARKAEMWAKQNGGLTLEMTPGGQWLDQLDLFGADSPVTRYEATLIWQEASRRFVQNASGQVRALLGNAYRASSWRGNSIYGSVELPTLRDNPKVQGLDEVYLLPLVGIL